MDQSIGASGCFAVQYFNRSFRPECPAKIQEDIIKQITHGKISQIIKADRDEVFNYVTDYQKVLSKTRMFKTFRIISKDKDIIRLEGESKFLWINFKCKLTGKIQPYQVDEEIIIDDGSIIKDHIDFIKIPEGTRLDWSGEIIKLGKWLRLFGSTGKFFFDMSTKKEFQNIARYIENGKQGKVV